MNMAIGLIVSKTSKDQWTETSMAGLVYICEATPDGGVPVYFKAHACLAAYMNLLTSITSQTLACDATVVESIGIWHC